MMIMYFLIFFFFFFFSSRRRHTRCLSDWSSDVCSSDLSRMNGNAKRTTRLTARLSQLFFGASGSPQALQHVIVGWSVSLRRPNQGSSPRARPMMSPWTGSHCRSYGVLAQGSNGGVAHEMNAAL